MRVRSVLAVSHDIFERKRYEQRMTAINEDLEREVSIRTQQLQNAIEELDSFNYSVSHDLRAPLRIIDGFCEKLLEDHSAELCDQGKDALFRIRNATKRMSNLIDGLLTLSRLSRSEMEFTDINLSELFDAVSDLEANLSGNRRTEVIIQSEMYVRADPVLMSAAVGNLMSNAFKYSKLQESPRIVCGAIDRDDRRIFYVRDNGVGFDMEYSGKLFTAFQRLHSENDFPGTGIGLATVRRVINKMGGSVWAESAVGDGATFYFTIGDTDRC